MYMYHIFVAKTLGFYYEITTDLTLSYFCVWQITNYCALLLMTSSQALLTTMTDEEDACFVNVYLKNSRIYHRNKEHVQY